MTKSTKQRRGPIKHYAAHAFAGRNIQFLLNEIGNSADNEFLIPSFIFAICFGLEGRANDVYIDFFHQRLGPNYKDGVKPFLYMHLKEKLLILIPLLSNFEYRLNEENQ